MRILSHPILLHCLQLAKHKEIGLYLTGPARDTDNEKLGIHEELNLEGF